MYKNNNVKQSSLNKGLQKSQVHSEPTVYKPVPLVGIAKMTEKGRESAKPAWLNFLDTKHLPRELKEEQYCSISLFQEYAAFLVQKIKNKEMALGTGLQYLSAAKTNGMKMFPNQAMWNESLGGWMSGIRHNMTHEVTEYNRLNGVSNSFKAPGIGRVVLTKVSEELLRQNSVASIHRR
jgi:hypothetical protein